MVKNEIPENVKLKCVIRRPLNEYYKKYCCQTGFPNTQTIYWLDKQPLVGQCCGVGLVVMPKQTEQGFDCSFNV